MSVRGFGEADLDNRIVCNLGSAGGRECGELPELLWREGNDLHVLAEQHHRIHGNGDRPASETEKSAEIDHDHDLTIAVADKPTNPTKNVLALDRAEHVPAVKIADANRLREPHGSGFRQIHTGRRWHAPRRRALRMRHARGRAHEAERKQDADRHRPFHINPNYG
jgi:hypothetical protein